MHDGHVGGPKQYNDFPLGNIVYFYANIFYCFSPPTWPPCTHSIVDKFTVIDLGIFKIFLCFQFISLLSLFLKMIKITHSPLFRLNIKIL